MSETSEGLGPSETSAKPSVKSERFRQALKALKERAPRVKKAGAKALAMGGLAARAIIGPGDDLAVPIISAIPANTSTPIESNTPRIKEAEHPSGKRLVMPQEIHGRMHMAQADGGSGRDINKTAEKKVEKKVDSLANLKKPPTVPRVIPVSRGYTPR